MRRLVMRLISRAESSQLRAAARQISSAEQSGAVHSMDSRLPAPREQLTSDEIKALLRDSTGLLQRYGTIAACRMFARDDTATREGLASSDADVRLYCAETINDRSSASKRAEESGKV